MNRLFKEIVNARFLATAERELPEYRRLLSAAKGGGCTLRFTPRKGAALFIGFETLAQRERVRLFCAWSRVGRTPVFDDVHESAALRLAGSTPREVFQALAEGCFDAVNLGEPMNVLDVEPDWVPWATNRERLRSDARFHAQAGAILGDPLIADLSNPAIPDRSLRAFSLSWEQRLMMIDRTQPNLPSADDVLRPLCDAMQRQLLQVFRPFLSSSTFA